MEGYNMKLTGELKDKVELAETVEAKKAILAEAGMELTDEELDGVAGGQSLLKLFSDDGTDTFKKPTTPKPIR